MPTRSNDRSNGQMVRVEQDKSEARAQYNIVNDGTLKFTRSHARPIRLIWSITSVLN